MKKIVSTILILTFVVTLLPRPANAATLVQYNFDTDGSPTTESGATGSTITNAQSFGTFEITSAFGYSTDPILRIGPLSGATDAASAISNGSYFDITVTPTGGNEIDFTSLTFKVARGGSSAPRGWVVRSSVDSYASTIDTADIPTVRTTWTDVTVDLSAAEFQDVSSAITFRIYVYSPGPGSTVEFDEFTFNGISAAPSSLALRSSSNYQLQSDSINVGGGLSTSTNYVQESTVGEIATGPSDSATYSLRAGYQQMQEVFISITTPLGVVMSPNLGGIAGGESNGSTTVTVTTDSPSGYQLTIEAEGDPAMQRDGGSETIADYVPTSDPNPDATFTTNTGDAHFGFNPRGNDIVQFFQSNGSSCNTGSSTELECWDGLATTSTAIAEGSGANHPSGATTTVYFKVGIDSNPVIAGTYTATTTLTALPL